MKAGTRQSGAPDHHVVDRLDVGAATATAFLCPAFAKLITGGTIHIDGGYNIFG